MTKKTVFSVIFFVCSSLPLFSQEVNLTEYNRLSPIKVELAGDLLTVAWQAADKMTYQLVLARISHIMGDNLPGL